MNEDKETVYRINGLSCTNCAAKFEKNVKAIPGVTNATVNFGASKISVVGNASIIELEKAGSFENLKLSAENSVKSSSDNKKFTIIKNNLNVFISALLLILAFFLQATIGEDNTITIIVFILAIVIGGYKLFIEGIENIVHLDFTMESLMTIAIIGASIIGEWSEGSVVVILFAISESLERYSMDKARSSIRSLMEIAPREALIRRDGVEEIISVEDIKINDIMIIKPGEKIAMDGVVIKGNSHVNQSPITGESISVEKVLDSDIFAGSLNEDGLLEVSITKLVEDTTIANIIHLVEEAQGQKAPAQAFVDKFAKYYTPIIMIIALLVVIVPPLFLGEDWSKWIYQGLSILVVGCPCSLVISTPVTIVSAITNAAKNGVLVKGGIHLEEVGKANVVAFDKTGTLTKGNPDVTDFIILTKDNSINILKIIASLEEMSLHPIANAITKYAREQISNYKSYQVENFLSTSGKGIQGDILNSTYYLGNEKHIRNYVAIETAHLEQYQALEKHGKTTMFLSSSNEVLAIISVADQLRESSAAALKELHKIGVVHSIMLTGDNKNTAEYISSISGVSEYRSDLLPHQKLDVITDLQNTYGSTIMIGDGINDAPALAKANVGIAMGGAGSDTALETSDIAFMGDDISKLPFIIKLSRKSMRIIKQNITFSIALKLLALLLVVPGWLSLWIAIAADMGATLLVTFNGMRASKTE